MAIFKNRGAQPYIELLYWFVIFSTIGFLMTFHKRHAPIDYEQFSMGHRIFLAALTGIVSAFFIWLLNGLLKLIIEKLFD